MNRVRSVTRIGLLFAFLASAQAQSASSLEPQLLVQAPSRLLKMAQKTSDAVIVQYIRVDLDGSGKFQYLLAWYSLQSDPQGIFLRVFKDQSTGPLLVGEQEDKRLHGGFGLRVKLVDINGDGIPEIEIEYHLSAGDRLFREYFAWTGQSLHSTLAATADPELEDLDGDGILELVTSNGDGTFNIYKYRATDFVLSQTVNQDPDGVLGADGKVNLVRANKSTLDPYSFALKDVQDAMAAGSGSITSGDSVRLTLANLADLRSATPSADQINCASVVLDRNLHPSLCRVQLIDANGSPYPSPLLELRFPRADLLRALAKSKLSSPLAAGDIVELLFHGKMNDGTRVSAVVNATITLN